VGRLAQVIDLPGPPPSPAGGVPSTTAAASAIGEAAYGAGAGRVRIVLADIGRVRSIGQARAELAEGSPIGDALVRGLVRAKLALALRLAAVVAIGLGGLPLLFAVAPSVATARPFGVVLPWLLLGVAAYPFLFAVGAAFVRLTERIEAEFTDLIEHPSPDSTRANSPAGGHGRGSPATLGDPR
jgi:hypothetical protein